MALIEEVLSEAERLQILVYIRHNEALRVRATVESTAQWLGKDSSTTARVVWGMREDGLIEISEDGSGPVERSLTLTEVGRGFLCYVKLVSQRERTDTRRRRPRLRGQTAYRYGSPPARNR